MLVNLALEPANSLLHDGHRWERLSAARIVSQTRRLLASRGHRDADFLVHASYAFIRAAQQSAKVGDRIRPIVEAALEAEALVLDSGRPACVLRVGYLYGPESHDLRLYRTAFRLGRPYWAGDKRRRQHFVHTADAAAAVLRAAARRPAGKTYYVTDDRPASFAAFGDHFAHLVGNPLPTHLPRLSKPFAQFVVAETHMQMVEIGVRGPASPRLPGFRPRYPDYRVGLEAVVETWR